jgi:hypothetical protein
MGFGKWYPFPFSPSLFVPRFRWGLLLGSVGAAGCSAGRQETDRQTDRQTGRQRRGEVKGGGGGTAGVRESAATRSPPPPPTPDFVSIYSSNSKETEGGEGTVGRQTDGRGAAGAQGTGDGRKMQFRQANLGGD